MTHQSGFAHQRLDAFHLSMRLTLGVERLASKLPRGHADLKDQVRRAASATTRNITEGANRWGRRDKAARFAIARGECAECDAALEMIAGLELGDPAVVGALRRLADRVGAMLTALILRERGRAAASSGPGYAAAQPSERPSDVSRGTP